MKHIVKIILAFLTGLYCCHCAGAVAPEVPRRVYCDVSFAAAAWRVQRATTYPLEPPAKAGGLPTWTVCDATPPVHVAAISRPVHDVGCTLDPINLVRLGSASGAHACHWVAIVPAARAAGLRLAAGVPWALVAPQPTDAMDGR